MFFQAQQKDISRQNQPVFDPVPSLPPLNKRLESPFCLSLCGSGLSGRVKSNSHSHELHPKWLFNPNFVHNLTAPA